MAIDISERYVKNEIAFPRHAHLHLLCRFQQPLKHLRAFQRYLTPSLSYARAREPIPSCTITERFEATRAHFQQHRWAYTDDIFDAAFHDALVSGWPPRRYFDPPSNMDKSYDIGFQWSQKQPDGPPFLDRFPAIKSLLDTVRSSAFAYRVSTYYGKPMRCYSFTITYSYPGSSVVPHKDTVAGAGHVPDMINLAWFINGTGGPRSGGLAIIRDNEFREVIFEPVNLRNSLLLYDSKVPFFHGFRPIQFGKFRWAIFTQFIGAGGSEP